MSRTQRIQRIPLQVAFLTGRSHQSSAALSPAQTEFLAGLPVPASGRVTLNFPYPADAADQPFTHTPLLIASVRGGWR